MKLLTNSIRSRDAGSDVIASVLDCSLPESSEAPQTPDLYLHSQSFSETDISPPHIPSDNDIFESYCEGMSSLPTQMQIFRDMFNDAPSWLLENVEEASGLSLSSSTGADSQSDISETHTGSLQDSLGRDTMTLVRNADRSRQIHGFSQQTYRRKSSSRELSVPSSDSFEIELGTSSVSVPAGLTFNPDAPLLADEKSWSESLPQAVKDFRDMFEVPSS
jgi:hypothetical protein